MDVAGGEGKSVCWGGVGGGWAGLQLSAPQKHQNAAAMLRWVGVGVKVGAWRVLCVEKGSGPGQMERGPAVLDLVGRRRDRGTKGSPSCVTHLVSVSLLHRILNPLAGPLPG